MREHGKVASFPSPTSHFVPFTEIFSRRQRRNAGDRVSAYVWPRPKKRLRFRFPSTGNESDGDVGTAIPLKIVGMIVPRIAFSLKLPGAGGRIQWAQTILGRRENRTRNNFFRGRLGVECKD